MYYAYHIVVYLDIIAYQTIFIAQIYEWTALIFVIHVQKNKRIEEI